MNKTYQSNYYSFSNGHRKFIIMRTLTFVLGPSTWLHGERIFFFKREPQGLILTVKDL
jgi:hypothetical protein